MLRWGCHPCPRRALRHRSPAPASVPAPGPGRPAPTGARTAFFPPAPPPRPGPSASHPFSATSELRPQEPPTPAPRALLAFARPRRSGITCLGALGSFPPRCKSVFRHSQPPPASPPPLHLLPPEWESVSVTLLLGRVAGGFRELQIQTSQGGERESKATRVGSGNKGEQRGEEDGGKEGQMGRGRKEREMGKQEEGRESLPSARL